MTALGERGEDVSNQIAGPVTRAIETIDQQMASLTTLMSDRTDELLAAVAARGGDLAASIASRVDDLRSLIDGNGFSLVTALGERGEVVSNQIAGAGARAVETVDQQMAGLTELLTRRTDELIAAVNGSAADPVRMLTALSGQLRAEVANSSDAMRNVAEEAAQRSTDAIDALLRRVTEQVEISGASLRDVVARSADVSVGASPEPATGCAPN